MNIIPGTETTVVTYIGESIDAEAMLIAGHFVAKRAEVIKTECSLANQCGAIAVREQFGNGINLARADFYSVSCDSQQCPMIENES